MTNEEAIKLLEDIKSRVEYFDVYIDKEEGEAIALAIKALENAPKKGKKINKTPYGWAYCSKCEKVLEPQDNFCWFCGADMREEQTND